MKYKVLGTQPVVVTQHAPMPDGSCFAPGCRGKHRNPFGRIAYQLMDAAGRPINAQGYCYGTGKKETAFLEENIGKLIEVDVTPTKFGYFEAKIDYKVAPIEVSSGYEEKNPNAPATLEAPASTATTASISIANAAVPTADQWLENALHYTFAGFCALSSAMKEYGYSPPQGDILEAARRLASQLMIDAKDGRVTHSRVPVLFGRPPVSAGEVEQYINSVTNKLQLAKARAMIYDVGLVGTAVQGLIDLWLRKQKELDEQAERKKEDD